MTEHTGLPVKGYQPQTDAKVALVNSNKEMEERLLRLIEKLQNNLPISTASGSVNYATADGRWLSIARTHFEIAFMALNRAIFQPGRIKLPEDDES